MDNISLQLYSFGGFDSTLSLEEKLRVTSEIGFKGVEYAGGIRGFDGVSAAEMKSWLQKYGLNAVSAHVPMNEIVESLPYLAEIGAGLVIVPSHPFATKAEALEVAELLNQNGKEAAKYGLKAGYHNHTSEFYVDEGKALLDYLVENTDPEYVVFELDCGWASAAGINPVEYIQKYSGRFAAIHVKENSEVIGADKPRSLHDESERPSFTLDENGKPIIPEEIRKMWEARQRINVPTGQGIVDWKSVKETADAQGCSVYIVEREWSYNTPPDRVACLREDFEYLKNNL